MSTASVPTNIDSVLHENRVFECSEDFRSKAHIRSMEEYERLYREAKEIGSLAKPDDIRSTEALPKTRSGKIMRRLLKEIAAGGEVKGDTTTLEDLTVISRLSAHEE